VFKVVVEGIFGREVLLQSARVHLLGATEFKEEKKGEGARDGAHKAGVAN
jgi:hypothetical protein